LQMKIEITNGVETAVTKFFSATPDTDAVQHEGLLRTNPIPMQVVTANFARKLERERDEAIRQLENIKASSIHTCHDRCQRPMCVLRRERDEAREHWGTESMNAAQFFGEKTKAIAERDEAKEQIKELIYIAERAIALAEIDFENDKFGVVSELRDGVERIKVGAK